MADFLSEGESSLPQPERAGLAVSPAPGGNDKEEDKDKDKYEDKYKDKYKDKEKEGSLPGLR